MTEKGVSTTQDHPRPGTTNVITCACNDVTEQTATSFAKRFS